MDVLITSFPLLKRNMSPEYFVLTGNFSSGGFIFPTSPYPKHLTTGNSVSEPQERVPHRQPLSFPNNSFFLPQILWNSCPEILPSGALPFAAICWPPHLCFWFSEHFRIIFTLFLSSPTHVPVFGNINSCEYSAHWPLIYLTITSITLHKTQSFIHYITWGYWAELCTPKLICWSSKPQYIRMWLYIEIGLVKRWLR